MKKLALTSVLCVLFIAVSFAQLTLKVTSLPPNMAPGAKLYVAGTFNEWNPGDENFQLKKDEDGHYTITFKPQKGSHNFKFTRGSWATVEGDVKGDFRPDRKVNYSGKKLEVIINIQSWEGVGRAGKPSTASENVYTLDKSFEMPQLERSRKIFIYLPPDYYEKTESYPVIYLQDGQNAFDKSTSFSGEWEVDESLNKIFEESGKGFIVVAISNGGQYRFDEYSAWYNSKYGGGKGDKYMEFIKTTLKPHIDETYRTLKGPQNTAIGGSSMGGLLSHYGALEHQDVFGKALVFSPSFWFAPSVFWHTAGKKQQNDTKVYMAAGSTEGGNMKGNAIGMYYTLRAANFDADDVFLTFHDDGAHSEWYWAREFPGGIKWLFKDYLAGNERSIAEHAPPSGEISVTALEKRAYEITYDQKVKKLSCNIVDESGNKVFSKSVKLKGGENEYKGITKIGKYAPGNYYMTLSNEETVVFSKELIIK